jgi:hypothetical protein
MVAIEVRYFSNSLKLSKRDSLNGSLSTEHGGAPRLTKTSPVAPDDSTGRRVAVFD